MQVLFSKQPMLKALHTFAVRDGKLNPILRLLPANFAGIRSLWSGLSASILRQTTYSTARFALYDILARNLQRRNGGTKLSAGSTIVCAGVSGGLAGMIGNPTEVWVLLVGLIRILMKEIAGSSGADVCRWCEGTSSEISVSERNPRTHQNWKRRRDEDFY
jgi:hypothetical protein